MKPRLSTHEAVTLYHIAKSDPARVARFAEQQRRAIEAVRRADELEDLRTRGGRPNGKKRIEIRVGRGAA